MTAQDRCQACAGSGWVCENHPDRPWENANGTTCCGGAGGNCSCNSDGAFEFQAVLASTEPETVKEWAQ